MNGISFSKKPKTANQNILIYSLITLLPIAHIDKGIVKWLVEFFDETDEVTGVATILTMVEKKQP
jgi:oxepin-CoA hydrolase/3-oxo-5,6-dehydrosuberyl-CoA semialdehyde dehydrogenase